MTVHHACPNWGVTNCNLEVFAGKFLKTSAHWGRVTCKNCLKQRPKQRTKKNGSA